MRGYSAILAAAATFWWLAPRDAAAQQEAAPPAKAVVGERMGSIHALMSRAYPDAVRWSPNAKLYTIQGRAPKRTKQWAAEEWTLVFGDPKGRDSYFMMKFVDGELMLRQWGKGKEFVQEYFWEGKPTRTERNPRPERENTAGYYQRCDPIDVEFRDTPRLEALLGKLGLEPDAVEQYQMTLSHEYMPTEELVRLGRRGCSGIGPPFLPTGQPRPVSTWGTAYWTVIGGQERLFLDPETGAVLDRRKIW